MWHPSLFLRDTFLCMDALQQLFKECSFGMPFWHIILNKEKKFCLIFLLQSAKPPTPHLLEYLFPSAPSHVPSTSGDGDAGWSFGWRTFLQQVLCYFTSAFFSLIPKIVHPSSSFFFFFWCSHAIPLLRTFFPSLLTVPNPIPSVYGHQKGSTHPKKKR